MRHHRVEQILKEPIMGMLTTQEGVAIIGTDGGRRAQPIVFHHGWPFSGDAGGMCATRPMSSIRRCWHSSRPKAAIYESGAQK